MEQDTVRCQDQNIAKYDQRIVEASEKRSWKVEAEANVPEWAQEPPMRLCLSPPRSGIPGSHRAADEDMPDTGGAPSIRDASPATDIGRIAREAPRGGN